VVTEGNHSLTFTGTAVGANKFINTSGTIQSPKAALQIRDGGQASDYVLTSDAQGFATWKPVTVVRVEGVLGGGVNVPFAASNFLNTGSYVDLAPGKWEISVSMLMPVVTGTMASSDWLWLKTTFSELNAATIAGNQYTSDFVGSVFLASGLFAGPKTGANNPKYSMLSGTLIINNTSASTKRYNYYAGLTVQEYTTGTGKSTEFRLFGGNNWGENTITATRLK